jgi:isocitrate/isopropylmalate dehydrogenase
MTSKHQSSRVEATLIPGDGIGPEIAEAVQIVLDAPASPLSRTYGRLGWRRSRSSVTLCRLKHSRASGVRSWP